MKLIKYFLIICTIAVISVATCFAQMISNVQAEKKNGSVTVTYELYSDKLVDLTLFYSTDNGKTWLPCKSISGDLISQSSGNKKIVWDCIKDGVKEAILQKDFKFLVERIDNKEKLYSPHILLGCNLSAAFLGKYYANAPYTPRPVLDNMSFDFLLGAVDRFGFYLKFKTNLNFNFANDALNIEKPIDYFYIVTENKVARMSMIGGAMFRISPNNWYLYAGLGYGYRSQNLQANKYDAKSGTEAGSVNFFYNRYKSVEIDAGFMVRLGWKGGVALSFGASCLPMRVDGGKPSFEIHAGLGFHLKTNVKELKRLELLAKLKK